MEECYSGIKDLTQGSVARQLFTFAMPIIIGAVLQVLYNIVDMAVVGYYCGSAGLSALSVGTQIFLIMVTTCFGFSVSGQVYIAQLVGQRCYDKIASAVSTLFVIITGMCVVVTVAGVVFRYDLLRLLNTPSEVLDVAADYMLICSLGISFAFFFGGMISIMRGMGDSTRPLYFVSLSQFVNVTFDIILVGYLNIGPAGAAVATILAEFASFAGAGFYLYLHHNDFGLNFYRGTKYFDREIFGVYMDLGIPFAVKAGAIAFSQLAVNGMVNTYGVGVSAIYGVGSKLQVIMAIVANALASGISTMVGQCVGAGLYNRVKKCVWTGISYCGGFYVICAVLFYFWPRELYGIFTSDEVVLAGAAMFLHIMIVELPAATFIAPINGLVQGAGAGRFLLITALMDSLIFRVGLSYLLGKVLGFGLIGFLLGNALAPYSTMLPNLWFFLGGFWYRQSLVR